MEGNTSRTTAWVNNLEWLYLRLVICLGLGLGLTIVTAAIIDDVPALVARFIRLSATLYCDYFNATEPLPSDHRSIREFGRRMGCEWIGIILNIPLYTLLIFGLWSLATLIKNRTSMRAK